MARLVRNIGMTLTFLMAQASIAQGMLSPDCDWKGGKDFQPCIQATIQKASPLGASVMIPDGTWPIGKNIVFSSNVTLIGESANAILFPTPENISKPVLISAYTVQNVAMRNLSFEGGGKDFGTPNSLIEFTKADSVVITDVNIRHSRGPGLVLQGGTKNSVVRHSLFEDLGNHWKTTRRREDRLQGVIFCCGENSHNEATDNVFRDIGLDAIQMGDQSDFKILRNRFELENHQREIVLSGDYAAAIFLPQSSTGLIQGNSIKGAQGNGIDAPGLQMSSIEANKISGSGAAGIGIFLGYDKKTQSAHVKIKGNIISNNVQWGSSSVFKGGITIAGGEPEDIMLESNTVRDDQGRKTQEYGLMITSETRLHGLSLKGNRFEGNASASVFDPNHLAN